MRSLLSVSCGYRGGVFGETPSWSPTHLNAALLLFAVKPLFNFQLHPEGIFSRVAVDSVCL